MNYLKWWDKAAAFRPDVMVAISELVKRRAWEYYGRAGIEVVYPPVAMVAAETSTNNEGFYLVISRLVAYKRIDLVIQACRQLGRPVVIVGHGPDRERLEEIAEDDPLVKFTGHVSQPELRQLLADCRAVLMPGLEDFGITACEAVAVGKPVILHHQSGAAELIQHLKQGVHLKNESSEALIDAINILETTKFQPHKLQQSMRKYVTTTFVKNWHSMVTKLWQAWQEKGVYECL